MQQLDTGGYILKICTDTKDKVVEVEDNTITLQAEFGYPIKVPINDVEHRPKDFDPDKLVAELADRIHAFEHRIS